jgi:hypothetical protein
MKPASAARLAPTLMTWAVLGVAGMYPIDNPDTFGHLALGRQIVQLGRVPQYDSFSYFQPAPARFVNYEWLSDWLFFTLYRAAGSSGLHALKLVLAGLLAWLLVRTAQRCAARTAVWLVPLAMLAGLPGIRFRWSVRPHLFGTVLAALYLLGLRRLLTTEDLRERRAWIVGLAAAHVLWVNLHGSHLLGLALTGLACACCWRDRPRLRRLAGLLGLMLVGSCVSPYGPAIVSDAIAHTFDARYRALIEEWQPYRLSQSLWYPATFVLQALLLAGAHHFRREDASSRERTDTARAHVRVSLFETAYVLLLLLMAARSLRFLADAVALTIPVVAAGWAQALRTWPPKRRARVIAATSVMALSFAFVACMGLPPQRQFGFGVSSRGRPEASARWLAAHWPEARVLAAMADAWDLMFSLPHARFLLDGRAPFYGPEHIARVQRAWSSPTRLRALLDSTNTDVVVAQPALQEQQPALRSLLAAPDFRLVAIEAEHCVFARARGGELEALALRSLQPGYDTAWLTTATLEPALVLRELQRLPDHPNVRPYAVWVRALLALRPLLREGGSAGVRPPRTPEERALLTAALHDLRLSHEALPLVQTVGAYHGLVAAALCELDEARAAFASSNALGAVRETLLGAQELALREGHEQEVRSFLDQASRLPQAQDDAWLLALRSELSQPMRCTH